MKFIFKYPRVIGGKLFQKSDKPQEVDKKHEGHWFTKALIHSGDMVPVSEDAPKEAPKPPQAEKPAPQPQQAKK